MRLFKMCAFFNRLDNLKFAVLGLLAALMVGAAEAALVTGVIRDRGGNLAQTNIYFKALEPVLFSGATVYPGWTYLTNSATNGTFTVDLHAGNYQVRRRK